MIPDEVEFALDDWMSAERGALAVALVDAGIPYRWEPDCLLVVPRDFAEVVDDMIDDLEGDTGLEVLGEDESDGGEEAQSAMADLFVVADRLQRSPFDVGLVDQLTAITATVGANPPPYGIEPLVWRRIHDLATAVVVATEGEDDDAVVLTARAVRELLRDYV